MQPRKIKRISFHALPISERLRYPPPPEPSRSPSPEPDYVIRNGQINRRLSKHSANSKAKAILKKNISIHQEIMKDHLKIIQERRVMIQDLEKFLANL